ncbi:MAG: hypothetical protein L6420_03700 [Elusimicrobia bacterium]|nr:hypothetical protein [Elusimicrobiota bacterium]
MHHNKLIKAIEIYNACNLPLFIDSEIFNSLIKARNKFFGKKFLLINLRDSPSNAHMERAFVRAVTAASRKKIAIDIFHSFENNYDFIERGNQTGFRIKYSGMSNLKDFMSKTKYDALIFIDLPYRDEELLPYAWLSLRDKTAKKFFIANDVLIPRGSIFGMDLAEDLRLLKDFSAGYVLDHCRADKWMRFGLLRNRIFTRCFAVDCDYFDGKESYQGNYVYSCGYIARDFEALFKAVDVMPKGFELKVYTDLKPKLPAKFKSKVEFVPYANDSSKMKSLIAGAKFVVLPIISDNEIRSAGLSVSLMAMAMGKIVLTRGNSLMHRYLKNGMNAFTYKESCFAGLSHGLKRILSLSPAEKDRIAANARETVFKLNNMDSFANEFIKKNCGE